MFITAKLLDVETARTILTDNLIMGTTTDEIQEGCVTLAKRLFHEEPKKGPKTTYTNSSVEEYVEPSNELIRYSKGEQKLFGVKEFSYGKNQMDEKMFINFLKKNNTKNRTHTIVRLRFLKSKLFNKSYVKFHGTANGLKTYFFIVSFMFISVPFRKILVFDVSS